MAKSIARRLFVAFASASASRPTCLCLCLQRGRAAAVRPTAPIRMPTAHLPAPSSAAKGLSHASLIYDAARLALPSPIGPFRSARSRRSTKLTPSSRPVDPPMFRGNPHGRLALPHRPSLGTSRAQHCPRQRRTQPSHARSVTASRPVPRIVDLCHSPGFVYSPTARHREPLE